MSKRPFAVFDIDGTLIRWQLFHAIVDELGKHGHVPAEAYEQIRAARRQWKQRTHATSFRDYESKLVDTYQTAITNLDVATFQTAVQEVFDEYKDQVYAYTRDLIRDLKAKDYVLFAISGSQAEVVTLLADYYGFDDYAGTTYEQWDGKFTGKRQSLRHERKTAALTQLIEKHGVTREGSLAIGDSEGDILILHAVETAIAFNPTKNLYVEAKRQHWKIVVERKNIVYELEPHGDTYQLS